MEHFSSIANLLPKPKYELPPDKEYKKKNSNTSLISNSNVDSINNDNNRQLTIIANKVHLPKDDQGRPEFAALANVGHDPSRRIQTSLKDMLPLQNVNISTTFVKPLDEEKTIQMASTKFALEAILNGKISSIQPKTLMQQTEAVTEKQESFIKYKSSHDNQDRLLRMVNAQKDPLEPPKFHHKRIPRPPPSPPAPVLHSPPRRKVTLELQKAWKVPPCISNWKNPKGYTIPLDKRLAADGRGLQDIGTSDRFAPMAEALYMAEKHSKEEVEARAQIEKKIQEHEQMQKEIRLQELAERAREERMELDKLMRKDSQVYQREMIRRERGHEIERELISKRTEHAQRESAKRELKRKDEKAFEGRDISERMVLGEYQSNRNRSRLEDGGEDLFDTRVFDRNDGISSGFHDEESYALYDKPLFGKSSAHVIYRPTLRNEIYNPSDVNSIEQDESDNRKSKYDQRLSAVKESLRDGAIQFIDEKGEGMIDKFSRSMVENDVRQDEDEERDPFGVEQFMNRAKRIGDIEFESSKKHRYFTNNGNGGNDRRDHRSYD